MLSKGFKEFVESLNAHRVDYLIVGGYALAAHGHPRQTGDLDVWIRNSGENAERLLCALDQFGFGGLGLAATDFTANDQVVQLGYPPFRIELLSSIDGVDFDSAWPEREVVNWNGLAIQFIGLDALKTNKRTSGRPQDLADLAALSQA